MDQQELLAKLLQIEEQAQMTLQEFPKALTKERLRMILALARYIRGELPATASPNDAQAPDTGRSATS